MRKRPIENIHNCQAESNGQSQNNSHSCQHKINKLSYKKDCMMSALIC